MSAILRAMADSLRHRGPDGEGVWSDADAGIGLAHRRLAVVDLSAAGAQPMASADGRLHLSYNGEIYNHAELRTLLDAGGGRRWRGSSDTETLLEAIATWGLEQTLSRCDGMFAMALWDRNDRCLTLVRDRFGERPLYVGWVGGDIVFGSELRALRCHPAWKGEIDAQALAAQLRLGYVPAPASIHRGVFKLPAGSLLRLRIADAGSAPTLEAFQTRAERYWRLEEMIESARHDPWRGSEEEAADHLRHLLDASVRRRMIADVPVGGLLSGGIDSSLVVASMQRQSTRPVQTFTVGFEEAGLDESDAAADIARCLGTEHHRLALPAASALALVDELPDIYDEPFSDAAQLPAVLVARAARRHVTVALSGDGADELFHGYQRYFDGDRAWRLQKHMPDAWRTAGGRLMRGLAHAGGRSRFARAARRQAGRLGGGDRGDQYFRLLSFPGYLQPPGVDFLRTELAIPPLPSVLEGSAAMMRFFDQAVALPEGIHAKLDRASLSCALELRVPFLDPAIAAFSWRLPEPWLHRQGTGKRLLRRLVGEQVGHVVAGRKKHGFDVPVADWLRGPLRHWAEALVSSRVARDDALLDARALRQRLTWHVEGRADYGYALWSALMYVAWRQHHG